MASPKLPSEIATFPDPVLTANLYCSGHLNALLFAVVRPVWRSFKQTDSEGLWYLWFMRYGKRGEHLKIRAHGPAERKHLLQDLLAQAAESYFSTIGDSGTLQTGKWKGAPPVDVEDRGSIDYPDRTLLWTDYARNHISLGGKPFLLDSQYTGLMTRCLSRAAEIALDALEPDEQGVFPHRQRQSALLSGLIAALAALALTSQQRTSYLQYHRDCLLRFLLLKSEDPFDKEQKTLDQFNLQAERMGGSFRQLEIVAGRRWALVGDLAPEKPGTLEAAWQQALVRLYEYVIPLCLNEDYHLDPFAPIPAFAPVFKALHGLANHLGVRLQDEAFAHHLLLLASDPEAGRTRRVTFLPTWE